MSSKHEIFNQAYQTHVGTGSQRKGQPTFNAVYDVDPALADSLRGSELDCFYNDSKIGQFMQVVCDSWDKGTHPPDDRGLKHREEHGRVVVEQDRYRDYEDAFSYLGERSQEATDEQPAAKAPLESKPKPGYTAFVYNEKPRDVYEPGSSDKHVAGVEVTAMPAEEKEAFLNLVAEFNEALAPYIKSYYRRFDRQKIQQ